MQRIGAIVMWFNSLLSFVIALVTIYSNWDQEWTMMGVSASIFAGIVLALLIGTGTIHAIAAIFPRSIAKWRRAPSNPAEIFAALSGDSMQFLYQMIGRISSTATLALIAFVIFAKLT